MKLLNSLSLLLLLSTILWLNNVEAQTDYSKKEFHFTGKLIGRDTWLVVLIHSDINNSGMADTSKLNHGLFEFYGTVNKVSEALLWTNVKNRVFDDPSVVRFLLEPNDMHIIVGVDDGPHASISGSSSQNDKELWDREKAPLLRLREQAYKSIYSNNITEAGDSANLARLFRLYYAKRDSAVNAIASKDVEYIQSHPYSYLSAYLLLTQRRKIGLDSIQRYFTLFPTEVKKSNIGYRLLMYIYPLTDDEVFRKENPLIDSSFDSKLRQIQSFHQLVLRDTSGNVMDLKSFKGKYLVIDFWASWCKPCIANIPALKQLSRKYDSNAVQFLSVSLDESETSWKRAIIKNDFPGIQLRDDRGFKGYSSIYCKVIFVPTYVIADQQGRIIKYNAPQAVDAELSGIISTLLKSRH